MKSFIFKNIFLFNLNNFLFIIILLSIYFFSSLNSYAQMSWDELTNRVIAVTKQLGELEKYVYNNPTSISKNPKDLDQNNSFSTGQQKRLDSLEVAVKELRGIIEIEYIKQKQIDELEIKISELKNIIENELQILRQDISSLENQYQSIGSLDNNTSSIKGMNLEQFNNQLLVLDDKIRIIDSRINTALDFIGKSEVRIMRVESLLNSGMVSSENTNKNQNVILEQNNQNNNIPSAVALDESGSVEVSQEPNEEGTLGLLSIEEKENSISDQNNDLAEITLNHLPEGTSDEQFKYALELALKRNFNEAELALSEFMRIHPNDDRIQDAHFWYGGVLFRQQKYEESAFNDIEFNDKYPNDPRTVDTTLRIAQAMSYVAQPDQACTVFENSLNFIVNPPERFVRKINELKADKACD